MPTSRTSSSGFAICQLEWRPSRLVTLASRCLGVLAAAAVAASDMPRAFAWPVMIATLAWGEATARRHRALGTRHLRWSAGRPPELDGDRLADVRLQWRGPLAFLQGREPDGCLVRLAWWPDTLPAARRRELRLVASVPPQPASTQSMAP